MVIRETLPLTRHRSVADVRLVLFRFVSRNGHLSAEDIPVHVTDSLLDIHQE